MGHRVGHRRNPMIPWWVTESLILFKNQYERNRMLLHHPKYVTSRLTCIRDFQNIGVLSDHGGFPFGIIGLSGHRGFSLRDPRRPALTPAEIVL